MDEQGEAPGGDHPVFDSEPGSRRAPRNRRRGLGCLATVVALVLLAAGGTLLVVAGISKAKDLFGGPPDYSGHGAGRVLVEVHEGDSAAAIGRTLKTAGVVKSVDAFRDEAQADTRSRGIQVGFYQLAKKMSAKSALAVLVDPDNLIQAQVTIPEGLTVDQTVAAIAKQTDFSKGALDKVLTDPGRLGLPVYADGNPEGFLFPATYEIRPDATPASVLRAMVARFKQAAADVDLTHKASALGRTPREVVTTASIIEREVKREQDLAGVAEVIDNRLSGSCPGTSGLLQMDSTVHFAAGTNDSVFTTDRMRAVDSPYNTYKYPGLPPGPISAPGSAALKAALNPTHQGYCYFVAVNLETGETLFAKTQAQHQGNVAKLNDYCATSDLC